MPSSWSTSLRFELQFSGENINLWGSKLNSAIQRADEAIAGWRTIALTGAYALVTANDNTDEAHFGMLKFTGTGAFAVTIPSVSKRYDIWNACTGILTITLGAGLTAAIQSGEKVSVVTDGSSGVYRVQPTDFGSQRITNVADPVNPQDAATKAWVASVAFTANAGILPDQPGNSGKFLKTNGSVASWQTIMTSDLGDYSTAILGAQVALAVAL